MNNQHHKPHTSKAHIRKHIRQLRKNISPSAQQQYATQIAHHICATVMSLHQQHSLTSATKAPTTKASTTKVALFLSMDGEINTQPSICQLWALGVEVYLPRIHPFNPQQLIFLRYLPQTPLITSALGIKEPQLNCQQLCPIANLDIIFTPLVAFDLQGHRLGMGGGYYDRTLAPIAQTHINKPQIIGLAHNCQQIEQVPTQPWDIPLNQIITPKGNLLNN